MDKKLLPKLKLSPNRTLSSQIYEFLRHQIVEKTILPGTQLSENDLTAHFDVSRTPVREAINHLSRDGLVEIQPQNGTFVTKISVNKLFEICFMRCAIETEAVRASLTLDEKLFKAIIKKLEKILEQQRKLKDKPHTEAKFLTLDDEFHHAICDFSQTNLAWEVLQGVKANMDRIRYLSIGTFSTIDDLLAEHEKLLEAILTKDIDTSCKILRQHAYEITKTYKPVMEKNANWFVESSTM